MLKAETNRFTDYPGLEEAVAKHFGVSEDLSLFDAVNLDRLTKCRCPQKMTPTWAKSLPRWATTAWDGASFFVRYDAHRARWCIVLSCGVDILARLAAVQPAHILTALS